MPFHRVMRPTSLQRPEKEAVATYGLRGSLGGREGKLRAIRRSLVRCIRSSHTAREIIVCSLRGRTARSAAGIANVGRERSQAEVA